MKLRHVLLLSTAFGMVAGCVHEPSQPTLDSTDAASSLTIYDVAENVLADEQIPVKGWTSLDIVMREGSYEESDGVFVKINGNVRFVPWLDLIADPLGQRFYSDAFVKAGELTLRVTKAPCGGRSPLVFQVRELRPKVKPASPETVKALTDIGYEPLSGWTESGIYLPDRLADRIDSRWEDQECQPVVAPPKAAFTQQALVPSPDIRPAVSDRQVVVQTATKPEVKEKPPFPLYGKPCRLCRKDDTGDDGYGGNDKW